MYAKNTLGPFQLGQFRIARGHRSRPDLILGTYLAQDMLSQCARMCQMQAIKFTQRPFDLDTDEVPNSCPEESSMSKSPGATVVEFGISLAHAELSGGGIPGLCSRCRSNRDPHRSTSHYPNVFCSERCEQDFIRIALSSLTLEDCIRMQKRLESLFVSTAEPAA